MILGHPPVRGDLLLAALLAGRAMSDEVAERLVGDGYEMRLSDRPVFPHLAAGPVPTAVLAGLLGISQQATSKAVADLEARGYVERGRGHRDRRTRPILLSATGRLLVAAEKRYCVQLEAELAEQLGAGPTDAARVFLGGVVDLLGADKPARGRRFTTPQ